MKKPPMMVAPSKGRFGSRPAKATTRQADNKLDHYDLDELKGLLPTYLENTGAELRWKNPECFECLCPLHDDRNPSLHAQLKDGVWLWKCWPCDLGGTVIDLHAELHGLSRNSREPIVGVAEVLGRIPIIQRGEVTRKRKVRTKEAPKVSAQGYALTEALTKQRFDLLSPFLSDDWKADLWHDSPQILDMAPAQEAHALVRHLFETDDVLWLGDIHESGSPKHRNNFRSRDQWLRCPKLPPRIAAGAFQPGCMRRSRDSLANSSFLIIEADELIGKKPSSQAEREENKKFSAALILFLQKRLRLTLRAVVDTGGKSLHAWFARPSAKGEAALASTLEGLGIDVSVFKQSAIAPLRLPGCRHHQTGKHARLLYLNPIFSNEDSGR